MTIYRGSLITAGLFSAAGPVPANNIAAWSGGIWSALGTGIGIGGNSVNYVAGLAASVGGLYAGGKFSFAGGATTQNVARWDGQQWHPLGNGLSGDGVFAVASDGFGLYAGGLLQSARNLAYWNGSAWSSVGPPGNPGVDDSVSALLVDGTDLYVGGYFNNPGGVPARHIARWDGQAWHALGSGTEGYISAMVTHGNDLYVGGQFTQIGGVSANNIARWNGSTWSSLGIGAANGLRGNVAALAISGNTLHLGGSFTHAGGELSNGFAQFALPAISSHPDEPAVNEFVLPLPINPEFPNCPGGYFIAAIDDGPAAGLGRGIFGLDLTLIPPGSLRLEGGLNFGGLLDGSQVAFAGFNIQNAANEPQLLELILNGNPAAVQNGTLPVRIKLIRQPAAGVNETVFETTTSLSLAQAFRHTLTISPGFHVVTVAPEGSANVPGGSADGEVYVSLASQFVDRPGGGFFGGVVVGGYHAEPSFGGTSGFASFCLGTQHATTARVLAAPSYGTTGAHDLRLRLLDHVRRDVVVEPH